MSTIPVSFSQFVKNPIAAVTFLSLIAMVYLYVDSRNAYSAQIEACTHREEIQNERITKLEGDLERLHNKFIELVTEMNK
jgi:hypothetical protein|tara:strand:- start:73 stop:312 length:240 start_codon:yes stop_codon:yes gene_type:complete